MDSAIIALLRGLARLPETRGALNRGSYQGHARAPNVLWRGAPQATIEV